MVIGGADGNLDEALQGLMAGAGVGDAIMENTVNTIDRAAKFVQRNVGSGRQKGTSNRELQAAIGRYESALRNANVNYNANDFGNIDQD